MLPKHGLPFNRGCREMMLKNRTGPAIPVYRTATAAGAATPTGILESVVPPQIDSNPCRKDREIELRQRRRNFRISFKKFCVQSGTLKDDFWDKLQIIRTYLCAIEGWPLRRKTSPNTEYFDGLCNFVRNQI